MEQFIPPTEQSEEKTTGTATNLNIYAQKASKRRERAGTLFWMFCISLGLFGLIIVNTSSLWNRFIGTSYAPESIGKLHLQKTDVRYRPSRSIVWVDLTNSTQEVGNGDTVFTARTGSAEIRFNNGNNAQILPNSLVVIQEAEPSQSTTDFGSWLGNRLESRAAVNILEGTVKLGFNDESKPIDLKIMGKSYRVRSGAADGTVKVSVDPTNSKKQVSITGDSKIEVESEGKKTEVEPGKIVAVSEDKKIQIEEDIFESVLPRKNARLVAPENSLQAESRGSIPFEWKRRKAEAGTLEIDGSEHIQISIGPTDNKTKALLKSGDYRWRIVSPSQKSGSPWVDFSTLVVDRPTVVSPPTQTIYRIPHTEDEKEVAVKIVGANRQFETVYELYSINAKGEVNLVKSDSIAAGDNEEFEVELEPGRYQVRARSIYTTKGQKKQIASPWTQSSTFAIVRDAAPTPKPTPKPTPRPTPSAVGRNPAQERPDARTLLKKPPIRPRNGGTIEEPLIIYP